MDQSGSQARMIKGDTFSAEKISQSPPCFPRSICLWSLFLFPSAQRLPFPLTLSKFTFSTPCSMTSFVWILQKVNLTRLYHFPSIQTFYAASEMVRSALCPTRCFLGQTLLLKRQLSLLRAHVLMPWEVSVWVCTSTILVTNCVRDALLAKIVHRSSHMSLYYYRLLQLQCRVAGKE